MRRLCRFAVGCVLAVFAVSDAAAQGSIEPPGAKLSIDAARAACRKARGLKLVVDAKAVRVSDFTGDGRADVIVDWEHLTCERRPEIFCGTGGCPLAIVVALSNGKFREVFRQQVLRYEIEPGEGARTIRFDLHGVFCGKAGPEPCARRHTISTTPFRFREP